MEENVLDLYTEKLENSTNPALIINQLYYALFEIPYENKHLPILNKLVKVYGRKRVLSALLEVYGMDKVDHSKYIGGLLLYFIKRELNRVTTERNIIDTTNLQKSLSKKRKLKVRNLFDEVHGE